MAFRTWILRAMILALLCGVGYGIWLMQTYVSPDAVRSALLTTFAEQFPEGNVEVGSASISVFGGISVRDLTMTRPGETEPFFVAPRATIYHDKEQINRGRLLIRKIELDGPTVRAVRGVDGKWFFSGMSKTGPDTTALPTFVITHGTLIVSDATPDGFPTITLSDANFTLVNDPAPVYLNLKGQANLSAEGIGANVGLSLLARYNRTTGQLELKAEVPDVLVTPALAAWVKSIAPTEAKYLERFSARLGLKCELNLLPNTAPKFELQVQLKDGRFSDPMLPLPLEQIVGGFRIHDGKLSVEKTTAKFGNATVELSLETKVISSLTVANPPSGGVPGELVSRTKTPVVPPQVSLQDQLERVELSIRELAVDDALFDRLPLAAKRVREKFQPIGTVNVGLKLVRSSPTQWTQELEVRPGKLSLMYENFHYRLEEVAGIIRNTTRPDGTDESRVELTGTAGGQRITINGTVAGPGPDPYISLRVSGTNVPIDDDLFRALPGSKYPKALRRMHATGRGDFVLELREQQGVNLLESTIQLSVYDGVMNYEFFPYPLEQIRGKITIFNQITDRERPMRPTEGPNTLPDNDRVELRDFTARHAGGLIWLRGDNDPVPGTSDRRLTFAVWGKECPIDSHLKAALGAIKLESVWQTFSPRGNLTFALDAEIMDRATPIPTPTERPIGPIVPPRMPTPLGRLTSRSQSSDNEIPMNPTTDLKLSLNFEGPTVTPDFFPIVLNSVAGRVKYEGAQVKVEHVTAKHNDSAVSLNAADVRIAESGQIWANIGELNVSPLSVDSELLAALPGSLRRGLESLRFHGPAELTMKHIVVLTPKPMIAPPARLPDYFTRKPGENATVARGQAPESFLAPTPLPDPDVYWSGELKMLGTALDIGVACERVKGRLACTGRYHGTYLGTVAGNFWIETGDVATFPVSKVKGTFQTEPQLPDPARPGEFLPTAFQLTDVSGTLFRGTVGGAGRVVLSSPVDYRLSATATDVRLEDLAKHQQLQTPALLEGSAQVNVLLETVRDPHTGEQRLEGYGKADVDRGRMGNLPVMVPLLKVLKLQAPDKTMFEEGHAVFTLRGDRVRVEHLDLLGSAISLGGSGELTTDATEVKFECYMILSQTLQRWLTTPLGDVTAAVSEKLFKIEINRKAGGELKYEPRVVPFVTDPFRGIAERVRVRRGLPAK